MVRSPWRQSGWSSVSSPLGMEVIYGGKDLLNKWVLSLEWKREEVIDGVMVVTDGVDGMKPEEYSPKTGWCIAESWYVILRGKWRWTSDGDERWRTSAARRLKRDQVMKISRLSGGESLVCVWERENIVRCVCWPMERFENRSGVRELGNFNNCTSKRVLDVLKQLWVGRL